MQTEINHRYGVSPGDDQLHSVRKLGAFQVWKRGAWERVGNGQLRAVYVVAGSDELLVEGVDLQYERAVREPLTCCVAQIFRSYRAQNFQGLFEGVRPPAENGAFRQYPGFAAKTANPFNTADETGPCLRDDSFELLAGWTVVEKALDLLVHHSFDFSQVLARLGGRVDGVCP